MASYRLLIVLIAASGASLAQKPTDKRVLAVAEDLRACILGLAAGSGSDAKQAPAIDAARLSADAYVRSLTPKSGAPPPTAPPEYIANAVALLNVCQPMLVTFAPGSPFAVAAMLPFESIKLDLAAKAADAQNTGGARLVPVDVQAVKNGKSEDGWTIYYQWLPGPLNQSSAFPSPTPHAARTLPPGAYSLHAEKTVEGKKVSSGEGTVLIGGIPTAHLNIRLP